MEYLYILLREKSLTGLDCEHFFPLIIGDNRILIACMQTHSIC